MHLYAFYLFDAASTVGYVERIARLYSTANALIEHVQALDNQKSDWLHHCPFFYYESFLCAAMIVLKILKNDYFALIVDTNTGGKIINYSVSALRKMSVANNDLPGRLSDVLAYLWTHPDPSIIGGTGVGGLQLKVQSRMSMSVVYDSLWRWREQYRAETEVAQSQDLPDGKDAQVLERFNQLTSTDAPSTMQDNQAIDIFFDLADWNGTYSEDLQFDWLT